MAVIKNRGTGRIFSLFLLIILVAPFASVKGQVRIRLFSAVNPESVIFTVTGGGYELEAYDGGEKLHLESDEPLLISKYEGKLAIRTRKAPGFAADSIMLSGTGKRDGDTFSLTVNGIRQKYSGDLKCIADLQTIVMINYFDEELYIAGVVRAEGGTGRHTEYLRTQAVIARTYMFKYSGKHVNDGYNLCDNTHCQAFNGITPDEAIIQATIDTKGQVILDNDSSLIISAFHSNCGGETSPAEHVWLTSTPYLKRKTDPYCISARNSVWQKTIPAGEWLMVLGKLNDRATGMILPETKFTQNTRMASYVAGSVNIPLRNLREELNLRSTYFSVFPGDDKVVLSGKGYGHGVGLCQEGAMVMAEKGFNYKQIIEFYYTGVIITDVKNAVRKKD